MLVKAQNRALDEQKALYSQIKSIQRDMTMTGQASQLPANYFTSNPNFIQPGLISRTAPSVPESLVEQEREQESLFLLVNQEPDRLR